ncbi:DUF2478 domain-containing protein [Bosea sp. (in: a-proteobacteria)]|uniref:DUF2478 domain-containing protein n=1 Tax=Bosea sp. (in: a-proteobacteria) TaxID=1871050 RepID=UPI00261ACE92|nr:DUF2478 domain-containing protein [Bosea sp. (in: a-proteobacteria)]MCO5091185.1 DUF2478 domain-containing protein [Bosea sp. (in: a-proteobacteria)]
METRPAECGILVLVHARDEAPDPVIARVVARLEAKGLKPRGLMQHGEPAGCGNSCATLYLDDIGMGRRVRIFEDRGPEAQGCRLDTAGLAVAAGWLREAVEARPDLLIVNRFGKHEGEGRGLREEIGMAVAAGIPIVIAVKRQYLEDWLAFAGEAFATAPLDAAAIEGWCYRALAAVDA